MKVRNDSVGQRLSTFPGILVLIYVAVHTEALTSPLQPSVSLQLRCKENKTHIRQVWQLP
jgi:hypothetical protein